VAWGLYDPYSVLSFRVFSSDKKPISKAQIFQKIKDTYLWKSNLFDKNETNCFRWINGEGDFLPGLVIDAYDDVAVLQFDGKGAYEFWQNYPLKDWLLELDFKTIYIKARKSIYPSQCFGEKNESDLKNHWVKENGIFFHVNIVEGQKTGFFLDQRDNRNFVKTLSDGRRVLNLFSYTGGFSLYAGKGNAKYVKSVDISEDALSSAENSWLKNKFDINKHEAVKQDIFDYLKTENQKWDLVIVDPPSLTHSEKNKSQAINKYREIFSQSLKVASMKAFVCFSSCSSHISFDDFESIVKESLSLAKMKAQVIRVSGQGFDHPYPHACEELRYLKFMTIKLV
jgi:23S rRNA (cytosine1962-C5)-methyltransferase